jgi:hypothetical protein
MEKFIYLFRGGLDQSGKSSQELQDQTQKWTDWMQSLIKKGIMLAGDPLHVEGKVVNAKKVVTDGPFIEAKEAVGGYIIVNARDINEAVEISMGCPIFNSGGTLEVRQIQKREV